MKLKENSLLVWNIASLLATFSVLLAAICWPSPAGAVTITNGLVSVDIRSDNGAIDTVAFGGTDYFNPGSPISDFGFQLGTDITTFRRNTTTGINQILPVTVTGSPTDVVVSGAYTTGGANLGFVRTYAFVSGVNVLRVSTVLTNNGISNTFTMFDTFDPDQGTNLSKGSGTFMDVLNLGGAVAGQASASSNGNGLGSPIHTSIIGSGDPRATVASGSPFAIDTGGVLNGFFTSPFDANGAFIDSGTHVGLRTAISAGAATTFVYDLALGLNPSSAQADFIAAQTPPSPVLSLTSSNASTLAFGPVLVGTTNNGGAGQNVTVENTGGGTLTGSFGGVGSGFNPTTAQGFSLAANANDSRTYNFAPTLRGAASDTLNITSDGGNAALNLTGQGVAPVAAVNTGSTNAGLVRIGTSGTASVAIQNTGDGNLSGLGAVSNLNGSVSNSAGVFTGPGGAMSLADGASQVFSYAYTPTGHVADSQSVSVTTSNGNPSGDNSGFNQSVLLQGQGVGPIYDSLVAPGGTLNYGEVYLGDTASLNLSISNTTTDPNGGDPLLTRMTLVGISLVGDPDFFVSSSFIGTTIDAGGTFNLPVDFAPTLIGLRSGTLVITTDVGAALGQVGQTFTYNLQGIGIVPEPTTATLGMLSAAGLMLRRRRMA